MTLVLAPQSFYDCPKFSTTPAPDLGRFNSSLLAVSRLHRPFATNVTNVAHEYSQHGREQGKRSPGSWHALGWQIYRFERLGKRASFAVY